MDESKFTHINGEKIWVIGAKNNKTGNIILDIFKALNQDEIKIFINNHFKNNKNIIKDGCSGDNFLDTNDTEYEQEVYAHDHGGNFGDGFHSTSHIEGVWGTVNCIFLQSIIKFRILITFYS